MNDETRRSRMPNIHVQGAIGKQTRYLADAPPPTSAGALSRQQTGLGGDGTVARLGRYSDNAADVWFDYRTRQPAF